jgi:hypothetical protein
MHICGRPLCFKSIPKAYVKKMNQEEEIKLPQAAIDFLISRFMKES